MQRYSSPIRAIFAVIAVLVALPATTFASDLDTRQHIEVTGTAEVKVVPDEFVIQATIQTFDDKLSDATRTNEDAVRKAFLGVRKLGVDRRYVVTDDIRVNAVTEGYRERGTYKRVGYSVSRNVTVILHDAMLVEPAMKKLFEAGVDRLTMTPGHTEIAKHLRAAQTNAARDAHQKASVLTDALGRTVGAPVSIVEQAPGSHQASNFVYGSATADLGDSLSLGKLKIRAAVRVKFLLK